MDEFEQQPFSNVEFVENPEQRCPVILLLDTSHSMNGAPIAELNAGLSTLRQELLNDRWRQNESNWQWLLSGRWRSDQIYDCRSLLPGGTGGWRE